MILRVPHKLIALLLPVAIVLAGCGNSKVDISSQSSTSNEVSGGTNGSLISIQSDNVQAAGYNVENSVMTVQFKNGALYEYYGVSLELWELFLAAQPHPWSQVGYPRLVQAGIPYKRIG